jgi:hypothetical protein
MKSVQAKPIKMCLAALILLGIWTVRAAGEAVPGASMEGLWMIDEKASDDTDRQVEKAIKAAGGEIPRTGKRGRERYRGGPPEQELYDRISYDNVLEIRYREPEFQFTYPQGYTRVFYTDNRSRSISAKGAIDHDYSFAGWEDGRLRIESRPRDGGWIIEYYILEPGGQRLRAELQLKPSTFMLPVEIIRVFNRHQPPQPKP